MKALTSLLLSVQCMYVLETYQACVLFPFILTEGPDPLQHTLPPQPNPQQQATPERGGFEHHAVVTFTAITHTFVP